MLIPVNQCILDIQRACLDVSFDEYKSNVLNIMNTLCLNLGLSSSELLLTLESIDRINSSPMRLPLSMPFPSTKIKSSDNFLIANESMNLIHKTHLCHILAPHIQTSIHNYLKLSLLKTYNIGRETAIIDKRGCIYATTDNFSSEVGMWIKNGSIDLSYMIRNKVEFKLHPLDELFILSIVIDKNIKLTPREIEIITLASQALSKKQILAQLGISASTVNHHFSNIYKKLKVKNRSEAIIKWNFIEGTKYGKDKCK